jgi:hypothetical protein
LEARSLRSMVSQLTSPEASLPHLHMVLFLLCLLVVFPWCVCIPTISASEFPLLIRLPAGLELILQEPQPHFNLITTFIIYYYYYYYLCFGGTGAFYYLSTSPDLFCFSYFSGRVSRFLPRPNLEYDPPDLHLPLTSPVTPVSTGIYLHHHAWLLITSPKAISKYRWSPTFLLTIFQLTFFNFTIVQSNLCSVEGVLPTWIWVFSWASDMQYDTCKARQQHKPQLPDSHVITRVSSQYSIVYC